MAGEKVDLDKISHNPMRCTLFLVVSGLVRVVEVPLFAAPLFIVIGNQRFHNSRVVSTIRLD